MDAQSRFAFTPRALPPAMRSAAARRVASVLALVALAFALTAIPAPSAQARTWAIQPPIPDPEAADITMPLGVSCVSQTTCLAVGSYIGGPAVAKRWDGEEWTTIPGPFPWHFAADVACTSATSCIAVGFQSTGPGEFKAVSAKWDGEEWSALTVPSSEAKRAALWGVSCATAANCIAVGGYGESEPQTRSLAMRWDGEEWTELEPAGEEEDSRFWDVSCNLATSCMAVGRASKEPLAEYWDGEEWSAQPAVPLGEGEEGFTVFEGVSCTGATVESTDCMAVGHSWNFEWTGKPTIAAESWDGEEWTVRTVSSPSEGTFTSVSCQSTNSCTAVGDDWTEQRHPIAVVWDGSQWVEEETVNPVEELKEDPSSYAGFYDVSCISAEYCTAVGGGDFGGGNPFPFAQATLEQRGVFLTGEESEEEASQPLLEAEAFPALLTGTQVTSFENVLTTNLPTACEKIKFDTKASEATDELSFGARYDNCSVGGFGMAPVSLRMNSCRYVLHVLNAGPPYVGAMDIACNEEGDAIEARIYANEEQQAAETPLCTIEIGPQSGLEGVELENVGSGPEQSIALDLGLQGIAFTRIGSPLCGNSQSNGTYTGGMTLSGWGF